MKKETKTWQLYWLMVMHILAAIAVLTMYGEHVVNQEVDSIIQLVLTIVVLTVVGFFFTQFYKLLNKALKRKKKW